MTKSHLRWVGILALIGFIVAWGFIYKSGSYAQAKNFVYTAPEIKAEFGEIRHAFLYLAKIKNNHANFSFYIFGERKNARIAIRVDEDDGHWTVHKSE